MKDQAIFQCQMFEREKLVEDNQIILVVARKPMPDELQPVIIGKFIGFILFLSFQFTIKSVHKIIIND